MVLYDNITVAFVILIMSIANIIGVIINLTIYVSCYTTVFVSKTKWTVVWYTFCQHNWMVILL